MLIELNDLRHSINRALNLGRYTIVVKTAGAEQVPASITLDLLERDDDGFRWPADAEPFPEGLPTVGVLSREWAEEQVRRAAETAIRVATDDHGPAVPDQRAAIRAGFDGIVDDLRTMRDMTALGEAITEVASGAAERRSSPGKWRVYRDGEKIVYETFDQPQPAADPMPPVGPLTSTEGLKAWDIIRGDNGIGIVDQIHPDGSVNYRLPSAVDGEVEATYCGEQLFFVARPGVWMPWGGGENPVPGLRVKVKNTFGREVEDDEPRPSERSAWSGPAACTAYMVVDTPPSSSET